MRVAVAEAWTGGVGGLHSDECRTGNSCARSFASWILRGDPVSIVVLAGDSRSKPGPGFVSWANDMTDRADDTEETEEEWLDVGRSGGVGGNAAAGAAGAGAGGRANR